MTYEQMVSYWPTAMAAQHAPELAARMNALPKVVFSRSLSEASWSGTRLFSVNLADQVDALKREPGGHIVVLGRGRALFSSVTRRVGFSLESTRAFANGNVLLRYRSHAR